MFIMMPFLLNKLGQNLPFIIHNYTSLKDILWAWRKLEENIPQINTGNLTK